MTKEKEQLLKRAKEYEKMLKNVDVSAKERKQQILIKIQKLDQRINALQKDAEKSAYAGEVIDGIFKEMGDMFMKKVEENAKYFPELKYFFNGSLFIRGEDEYVARSNGNCAWGERYHSSKIVDKDYVFDALETMSSDIIEAFESTAEHWYDDSEDEYKYVFKQTPEQAQRVKKINKARSALKFATSEKDKLEKELRRRGLGKDAKQNLREELAVRERSISEGMAIFQ